MSDVSDPLLTCDADVVGSDANLNYNTMLIDDADVVGSDAALNNNTMHIDDADVVGSDAALNDNTIHVDMDVDVTAENTFLSLFVITPVACLYVEQLSFND